MIGFIAAIARFIASLVQRLSFAFLLYVSGLSALLATELNWEIAYQTEKVQVWNAEDEAGNTWVKAETVVLAPYWSLLNLLRDTQSAADWIDNVIDVKVVVQPDTLIDVVYSEFYAPWPFSNRTMSTKSILSFNTQQQSLSIDVRQHPKLFEKPHLVSMEDVQGTWKSTQISDKTSRITWQGTAKPGGNIPSWLAQKEMKKSTLRTFQALYNKVSEKKYQDKPLAYPSTE